MTNASRSGRRPIVWIGILCFIVASCINELPVDVVLVESIDVSLEGLNEVNLVGTKDTVRLVALVDGVEMTGLRVRWGVADSSALAVRALVGFGDLNEDATVLDSLNATLLAELTFLRRGSHSLLVQIDSLVEDEIGSGAIEVTAQERWQSVSAGSAHTCAVSLVNNDEGTAAGRLRTGGEAFCWGEGRFGALGAGSSGRALAPTAVESSVIFDRIGSGNRYTCGLDRLGLMHCWGDNVSGQLGLGNFLDQFVPRLNSLGEAFGDFDVGKGVLFTCAVRGRDVAGGLGVTLCWGSNVSGVLGCGSTLGCDPGGILAPNTATPIAVIDASNGSPRFTSLSLGASHACGVEDGTAFCWGSNSGGALGAPTTLLSSPVAIPVSGASLREIAVGGFDPDGGTSCGITEDGNSLLCWGASLGSGGVEMNATPQPVEGVPDVPLRQVTAGRGHACVLTEMGDAYCWGDNTFGQLGDGTEITRASAAMVSGGLDFEALTVGQVHTCGITREPLQVEPGMTPLDASGRIYCWGNNSLGQLGNGTQEQSSVPLLVVEPTG
jgi:alpha-tubulin suppressor-like RCC1 family protein